MNEVIFLVSGNGGNLKFVHHAASLLKQPVHVSHVLSDRECGAIDFAREQHIDCSVLKYNRTHTEELDQLLGKAPQSIVITNIHKILAESTLSCDHVFMNLHYSLLPAFKGLIGMETVTKAKELNCRFVGASTHQVVAEVDSGEVLQQGCFATNWSEAETEIQNRVFRIGSILLLNTILETCNKTDPTFESMFLMHESITLSDDLYFDLDKLIDANIFDMISG